MKKFLKLIVSIIIPFIVGGLGSLVTMSSLKIWYENLNKPFFNPPNWIFFPVWNILFFMIGLSFFFVWQKGFGKNPKKIIGIYSIQLLLNFLWSFFFFYLQNPYLAFIEIIILNIFVFLNLVYFYEVDKKSGYLLIPYLLWGNFAMVLNFAILILN